MGSDSNTMKPLNSVSRRNFLNQLTASVRLAAAAALNLEVSLGAGRAEKPNILWERKTVLG